MNNAIYFMTIFFWVKFRQLKSGICQNGLHSISFFGGFLEPFQLWVKNASKLQIPKICTVKD